MEEQTQFLKKSIKFWPFPLMTANITGHKVKISDFAVLVMIENIFL